MFKFFDSVLLLLLFKYELQVVLGFISRLF